jgi:hypothetical protein
MARQFDLDTFQPLGAAARNILTESLCGEAEIHPCAHGANSGAFLFWLWLWFLVWLLGLREGVCEAGKEGEEGKGSRDEGKKVHFFFLRVLS